MRILQNAALVQNCSAAFFHNCCVLSHRPLRGATRTNLVRARERTRNSFVRGAGGLEEIIEAWDMDLRQAAALLPGPELQAHSYTAWSCGHDSMPFSRNGPFNVFCHSLLHGREVG